MAGYVKLYRQMETWEWYLDVNTTKLFIHCLLRANHKPKKWQGETIETGSFITSLDKLSAETGLSVREIRTSLKRLKSTHEVTHETTSQYSVINVVKWADYQGQDDDSDTGNDIGSDKQTTSERQTNDKQTTTNKNDKNDKNVKNKEYIGAFDSFSLQNPQLKEVLKDYKAMRTMMKKKMTERAEQTFINKLESLMAKGHDGLSLIDEAISKNWLSVYEPFKGKSDRADMMPAHTETGSEITEKERQELFDSLNSLQNKGDSNVR